MVAVVQPGRSDSDAEGQQTSHPSLASQKNQTWASSFSSTERKKIGARQTTMRSQVMSQLKLMALAVPAVISARKHRREHLCHKNRRVVLRTTPSMRQFSRPFT